MVTSAICPSALNRKRRIGILGGTFNPIHCGHVEMARAAYREFGLDEVWLMPSKTPPHKPIPDLAAEEDRLAMVTLACQGETGLYPSTVEMDRVGVTYTVDTLRALCGTDREEFLFIVGSDTVFQIETWREYQAVLSMISFIVFIRSGEDVAAVERKANELATAFGGRFLFSHAVCPNVSSTEVRMCYQRGGSNASFMVPTAVDAYIRQKGLYLERH